jgi:hypothetical protein
MPLASLLTADRDEALLGAAIDVLRRLGPRAREAVPAMVGALTELPAIHTASLIEALARTAPWCRDVMPFLMYSASFNKLTILGKPITGTIDGAVLNRVGSAAQLLAATKSVAPDSTLDELAAQLDAPSVSTRECALAMLRERGDSARSLLPKLVDMLTAKQPQLNLTEWINAQTVALKKVDRSAEVHAAVAEAILAIAKPNDPERKTAQSVLERR